MTITLSIPIRYPYKNELTPSLDRGAFLRFQARKREFYLCTPNAPPSWRREKLPIRLIITRLIGKRQRYFDVPNLYYPLAFIVDNLVKRRWIPDDDPRYLVAVRCIQRRIRPGETKDETLITLRHVNRSLELERIEGTDPVLSCPRCDADLINIQDEDHR